MISVKHTNNALIKMKTLYALLGVEPDVDAAELETAFLSMKARYPQTKIDADESARLQFQGIRQAYSTLSNPATRAMYDQRLAKAGVKTAPMAESGDSAGWLSTRNIIISGVFVLVIACMWFYHVHEQARLQRELAE